MTSMINTNLFFDVGSTRGARSVATTVPADTMLQQWLRREPELDETKHVVVSRFFVFLFFCFFALFIDPLTDKVQPLSR